MGKMSSAPKRNSSKTSRVDMVAFLRGSTPISAKRAKKRGRTFKHTPPARAHTHPARQRAQARVCLKFHESAYMIPLGDWSIDTIRIFCTAFRSSMLLWDWPFRSGKSEGAGSWRKPSHLDANAASSSLNCRDAIQQTGAMSRK